jgi:hypothetical protein
VAAAAVAAAVAAAAEMAGRLSAVEAGRDSPDGTHKTTALPSARPSGCQGHNFRDGNDETERFSQFGRNLTAIHCMLKVGLSSTINLNKYVSRNHLN